MRQGLQPVEPVRGAGSSSAGDRRRHPDEVRLQPGKPARYFPERFGRFTRPMTALAPSASMNGTSDLEVTRIFIPNPA